MNSKFKHRHTSRRQFLQGAGTMLAIPALTSLMPKKLAAQILSSAKRRSVSFVSPFGIDPENLFPANQANLSIVSNEKSVAYKRLSQFGGQLSPVIDSSFATMYDKMNVYHGLSLTGGLISGHNTSILSGTHSGGRSPIYGKSFDVILEKSSAVYANTENVPHKAIRISSKGNDAAFSFDRVNGQIVISDSIMGDTNLFNTLFGNFQSGPVDNSKKQIVDKVYEDLKSLEGNSRLSKYDKNILDRYITGINDLQKKLVAPSTTCNKPSLNLQASTSGNKYQFPENSNWGISNVGRMFENYIEIIRLAFACDLTRVVHIGNNIWSDSPISVGTDGGMHHDCPTSLEAAKRQKWGLDKMLKLAIALDADSDPHGSGSILDNSVIFWTNELGAWTTSHNTLTLPAISFGSCGGALKTGYYMDYRQRPLKMISETYTPYYPGRPYKQILQTIMSAMGVPKSEYIQFGDGNGFGEFNPDSNKQAGMFADYANEHNEPLPFIYNG